jgi:hypothetical protein
MHAISGNGTGSSGNGGGNGSGGGGSGGGGGNGGNGSETAFQRRDGRGGNARADGSNVRDDKDVPYSRLGMLLISIHFMQVFYSIYVLDIEWPAKWDQYNPFFYIYQPFAFDFGYTLPFHTATREKIKLAAVVIALPVLYYLSEHFWSQPLKWQRVHVDQYGHAVFVALRQLVLSSFVAVFVAVVVGYQWEQQTLAMRDIVAIILVPVLFMTLSRLALIFLGRTIYLTWQGDDAAADVLSDRFFHSMRLSLRKLSLVLFMALHLPMARAVVEIVNTNLPERNVTGYIAVAVGVVYVVGVPLLLLLECRSYINHRQLLEEQEGGEDTVTLDATDTWTAMKALLSGRGLLRALEERTMRTVSALKLNLVHASMEMRQREKKLKSFAANAMAKSYSSMVEIEVAINTLYSLYKLLEHGGDRGAIVDTLTPSTIHPYTIHPYTMHHTPCTHTLCTIHYTPSTIHYTHHIPCIIRRLTSSNRGGC